MVHAVMQSTACTTVIDVADFGAVAFETIEETSLPVITQQRHEQVCAVYLE